MIDTKEYGRVLRVRGADLMDGTPIFDIKPYLPFCDSYPDAKEGFAGAVKGKKLNVIDEKGLLAELEENKRNVIVSILEEDPRPSYQSDPERVYSFEWAGYKVRFSVDGEKLFLQELFREG